MKTNAFALLTRRTARYASAVALVTAAFLASCSHDKQENPTPAGEVSRSEDSSLPRLSPPYVIPDTLKTPANARLVASVFAAGVQIYEVRRTAADTSRFEWAFVAPEATLYGADYFVVGRHYAGPTWESNDGSTVVGRVLARRDAPNSQRNIPWLLLTSRANTGTGIFSRIAYVQRLNTRGGQAPAPQTATRATLGRQVRIPYTATYTFYTKQQ